MNSQNIRYTALGDSIGFGLGASLFQGYVFMLGRYLKCICPGTSVRNLSKILVGSEDLLHQVRCNPRVRYLISASNLITICVGGNNLLRSTRCNHTIFDGCRANCELSKFTRDFIDSLNEIRYGIGYFGPIFVMTIYNPLRIDDPQYLVVNPYILALNSVISNNEIMGLYGYEVVDVYGLFETAPLKDWTHFYGKRRNVHPNNEGHAQIFNLHRSVIGI